MKANHNPVHLNLLNNQVVVTISSSAALQQIRTARHLLLIVNINSAAALQKIIT